MVDQKITELDEDLAPALTDLAYTVEDPGGTPTSKNVTWENILNLYNDLEVTMTDKTITQPLLKLVQGPTPTPGGEGDIEWDTDDDALKVGGAAVTRTFSHDGGTATLTNKTIDTASNTLTVVEADISDLQSYITAASVDTLTNKTIDANGTGNSISNIDVADLANGTDGELITWDAAGAPAVVATGTANQVLTSNGAGTAPTFQANPAGFTDPMTTRGDIIIRDATNTTERLAVGTNTQVLTSDGTDITWEDSTGGGDTVVGTQPIEVDASALYPGGATPATAIATYQFGAQNQPVRAIKFPDGSNTEAYYQFKLNNWNAGTIKVKAYWFVLNDIATPESTTFELDCSAVGLDNFDAIGGTAYGTAQTITDTTDSSAAEDKINESAASASITIASPATLEAGDWISLKMVRDAATDTAGDVYLSGITIEYTIATGTATI